METLTFLLTTSFYPPYHVGGACVHVKYLAEELARRGHEIHVMHSLDAYRVKRGDRLPMSSLCDYKNLNIHTLEAPLKKLDPLMIYTTGTSFYVRKRFSEITREINPDVIHHHNISLLGHDIINKRSNTLSLYTAHDYWLICPTSNLLKNKESVCTSKSCFSCAIKSKRPPQLWRYLGSYKKAIKNIDLMIVPSDFVRRRLAQEIDVRSITIPNFVPFPPHISSEEISALNNEPYFLFVGMLEIHKGIVNLLELFKALRNKINAKLIIVGDGSLKDYIQEFIKQNSLDKLISYKGFVDNIQLYSLYRGALALIIPSIWPENAPLVALESISVGTPVISSCGGGLPEIVGKIDKKLIFHSRSELEDILVSFCKEQFPLRRIRQVYEQNFSPKAYVSKYIDVIRSISR